MHIRTFCSRALLIALLGTTGAMALELDDAKTRGLVGETAGGYLASVVSSPEVEALIDSINSQRKAHYQEIANKNGISLEAVEVRAGKKAIEKTPAGEFISTGSGWQKK
ncbi:MAG: YdbL family protein [Halioglobus sp.]